MTIGVVRLSPVYNISIHMPHTWHDGAGRVWSRCHRPFQSTCHIRGMTPDVQEAIDTVQISIHMPHTWHDFDNSVVVAAPIYFNPHATYVA